MPVDTKAIAALRTMLPSGPWHATLTALIDDAHDREAARTALMDAETVLTEALAERDRLAAENAALREAAAGPVVHLAVGQVAVWPWVERSEDYTAIAVNLHGKRWVLSATTCDWIVQEFHGPRGEGGTAGDLASAKTQAETAVVRLAKGVDAAPAAKEAR